MAAAGRRSEHHRAGSRPFLFRELPRNASHDRRCALQPQRRRAGRGVSSRDGQDAVGAGAVRRPGSGRVSRHQRARRCALGRRQRPTPVRRPRRISDRAGCRDRKAGARVRGGRAHRPEAWSWPTSHRLCVDRRPAGLPRRRHRRRRHWRLHVGSSDTAAGRARGGAGLRRPHRKAAMEVQPHSATGRGRQRNMGGRLLVVQRRRQPLVADLRGRRGAAGVPADDVADQRHVRRTPARQQPVRQHARMRPVRDG